MLQEFRKISHGWLAWVIFALIAIVFALFGVEGLRMGSGSSDSVTIGGEKVSKTLIRSMERYFPQFNADRALEVNSKLESLGFIVTDEQINDAVVNLPAFQEDGKFSVELYKKVMGFDPNYLYGLRKILAIELKKQQLADLFLSSSSLSKQTVNKAYELFNEARTVEIVTVPYGAFIKDVSVSEEEINNYYNKNKSKFISPEKIKLEYVLFDKKDLVKNIHIPESEILSYYNQNKSSYTTPERREVAQIVLSNKNNNNLKIIEKELSNNKNSFESLAKKYSTGLNASKGGNIGYFQKGDMEDKILDDAVFSIKSKGEISKPVSSGDKVYIFKLLKVKPEFIKPFSDVKDELKLTLEKDYVNNKYIEKRDEIANRIYEIPDSLKEVAKDNNFKILSTNWLSKSDFNVSGKDAETFQKNIKEIYTAAFSEDVLNNANNSELLELGDDKIMVLRVLEHKISKQQEIAEVKKEISSTLRIIKAQEKANSTVKSLEKEIKSGKSLKSLAAHSKLNYKTYSNLKWGDLSNNNKDNLSSSLIDQIFMIPVSKKTTDGKSIKPFSSFKDIDGNSKIIVLDKVILAEASKASKQDLIEISTLLNQSKYMIENSVFWKNFL